MYKKIGRYFILSLLPYKIRELIRYKYKIKYNKKNNEKLSLLEFNEIMSNLGIQRGSTLFIHSSVDRLNLDFPFYKVFPILIEMVGEEGTLLFPCTHIHGRPEEFLRKGGVFDINKSPTSQGILPEFVRKQKGAFRSLHPTSSVVAIGKNAKELIETHANSIYPCGEHSPYYKIVKYDGVIIGLGVSTEYLSFVHCIEDIWKERFPVETRAKDIYEGKVIDSEGKEIIVKTFVAHKRIIWRDVPKYIKKYIPANICQDLKINNKCFFKANSKLLYKKMEELATKNITIYSRFIYKDIYSKILRLNL